MEAEHNQSRFGQINSSSGKSSLDKIHPRLPEKLPSDYPTITVRNVIETLRFRGCLIPEITSDFRAAMACDHAVRDSPVSITIERRGSVMSMTSLVARWVNFMTAVEPKTTGIGSIP